MELEEKVKILSASAKYDVSCASSGSSRKNTKNGIGNASLGGICHSWTSDGRCISLLKVLFSNSCIYDCAYCINKKSNDIPRATFKIDELISLTLNFYKRNYIEGLFLSSAIFGSPNITMKMLYLTAKKLREEYNFNGYIHLKAIPGADLELIRKAGFYADRMSVNIELPSERSLKLLAPDKSKKDIITPMNYIGTNILALKEDKKKYRHAPNFIPAGQSTQLIVGATPESDLKILTLSEALYKKFHLKRVYYSAFQLVNDDDRLPKIKNPPLLREHRLYQADWLIRYYGFSSHEILNKESPFLDDTLDPKTAWALRNFHLFPIEINKAPYELLLRIPGVGVKSAKRIMFSRKLAPLTFEDLKKIGVVLKRAKYFITCNGKYYSRVYSDPQALRLVLISEKDKNFFQLPLFNQTENLPVLSYF